LAQQLTGTVRSFKEQWGFLNSDGVDGDILVHVRDNPGLGPGLQIGDAVYFDLASNAGKLRAVNAQRSGIDPAQVLHGTVVRFRDGWGLLESSSLDAPLYCGERDNPHLKEISLAPGDEVSFELGTNPADGRSKAINVSPKVCDQGECIGMRVRGAVKTFNNGWGFATSHRFGGKILLGKQNLLAAGLSTLQLGDTIEFEVALSASGKYEAVNIAKVVGSDSWRVKPSTNALRTTHSSKVQVASDAERFRSRSPHVFRGSAETSVPAAGGSGRYTGTVRTFRDGWGFIASGQVEGDIYVNAQSSPALGSMPLQPGESVEFELIYRASERNNGAQAVDVRRVAGGNGSMRLATPPLPKRALPVQEAVSATTGYPPPPPMSSAFAMPGTRNGTGRLPLHSGMLTAFKDGWGWIQSSSIQGDVFFGLRDNPHLPAAPNVGDQLAFELGIDPKKGRHKALNVSPSSVGKRVVGVVSSMRDGWGFATSEQVEGSILLGKKNLAQSGVDGSTLQVGQALEFEVCTAVKGYEAIKMHKL